MLSACLAGFLAGLMLTGLQWVQIIPIILEAETYEGAASTTQVGHSHGAQGAHSYEHQNVVSSEGILGHLRQSIIAFQQAETEWAPADGWERTLFTAGANILLAIGFALLLNAAFAVRQEFRWQQGIFWGLAGYAVFFVLPALGLPPEIPGTVTTNVVDRQGWWLMTVICSGVGLALLILQGQWIAKIVGAVLLVVPHLFAASYPEAVVGTTPQELADAFLWATAIVNGIFWLVLGTLAALTFEKLA